MVLRPRLVVGGDGGVGVTAHLIRGVCMGRSPLIPFDPLVATRLRSQNPRRLAQGSTPRAQAPPPPPASVVTTSLLHASPPPLPRSATISLLHVSQPSASFTSTEELAFSPEKNPTTTSLPAAPAMRRLPLRLLRSAAAGSLRSPTLSRGSCPVPRAPHLPAEAAAAPAELARWLPRRGYSRFASGFTPLEPKKLGSILDVERAKGLSPEHLVAAWDDYHLGRGHIGVSMKAKLYRLLEQRSATCPYFVIPLWRGSGYTTMFMQVQLPHMIFTGLEDYKARGTQASPYYTITHFTEFAETKDTVLVRGDVVFTSKLTDAEAKCLLETAHSFYLNDVRYKLVERFNKETHDFEFKDVLQALEMPSM